MSRGLEKKKQLSTDVMSLFADDLDESIQDNVIKAMPVNEFVPFHKNPFSLYEGKRFENMVDSIRAHGILVPIIARSFQGNLEILSGRNRVNAAKEAGMKTVPTLLKSNLSEAEAYTYVIETNLLQRGFAELSPSEQAAALELEYSKVISQGRRNDIIREIERLSGIAETSDQIDQKLTSREAISRNYGLSASSMARLLRINHLILPLKQMVDDNKIAKGAYFHLSFLPEEKQLWIYHELDTTGYKISGEMAKMLRDNADILTEIAVHDHIAGGLREKQAAPTYQNVKLDTGFYQKYFKETPQKEVAGIIEKALEMYFEQVKR